MKHRGYRISETTMPILTINHGPMGVIVRPFVVKRIHIIKNRREHAVYSVPEGRDADEYARQLLAGAN